ncbi:type VI secretion system Vgr family protein [Plebeiibacterium sediminum]|uniref:Phage baseplate assembly protein V n=1 Tax=Plebeiibacterium sediminum TaxID=2992112 RepID=A0AAE3SI66_9BACT|nr:phage baseplate assembly protein V [Plebeiobacterium sediminum]MCW3788868.1 phage baseplate assembly protein V [Plebeiobacterium sediminum]
MALQTIITVAIDGQEYQNINNFYLSQCILGHHHFTFGLLYNHFEEDGLAIITKSQDLIGQTVNITICNFDDSAAMAEGFFAGVITEVEADKSQDSLGGDCIVIKGYSPTILMDNGPHCNTFEKITLSDIVGAVSGDYGVGIKITPLNTNIIEYAVQYNQSSFEFIKHLAIKYGEWMYYDGQEINFGTNSGDEITLSYGVELTDFKLRLITKPKLAEYVTNDYYTDKASTQKLAKGTALPDYYSVVAEKSKKLYIQQPSSSYLQHSADGSQDVNMQTAVGVQAEGKVAGMVLLTGTSRNSGVKIGSTVSIVHQMVSQEVEYGKYVVVGVKHFASESGDYQNHFEAIPEGVVNPPYTNIHAQNNCSTQRAVVMENADPETLGRIRVQFPWQTSAYSPWIRIAQPHGGANKGFHFIPELGEEVMVGFEGNNVEMPFVIGSLYNGTLKVDEFTTENNDAKVIRTRSGHTIELNDKNGEEKINIYDNEGSVITFDTANKSLIINSAENIDIAAKNINISAEENIVMGAKGNIDIAAEGDLNKQAKGNVVIQSDGDVTVNAGGAATVAAKTDAAMSGQNVSVEGKMKAGLVGTQTTVEGKMTAVQGASGKVEVM